jgi:hypothetical protein
MRLKNLMVETRERSVAISEDNAIDDIKAHCKDALKNYKNNKRIYRGVYMDENAYLVKPGEHTRVSKNTYNTYTLLIDNSKKWAKYPKRSKSIICSTAITGTSGYGQAFVVFPKDGYKFGVCPTVDMWDSFNAHLKVMLNGFNESLELLLRRLHIDDHIDYLRKYADLLEICRKIDLAVENTQEDFMSEMSWTSKYHKFGNFLDLLEYLFDPEDNGFKLENDISKMNSNEREVWTDSDCYLINYYYLSDTRVEERLIG